MARMWSPRRTPMEWRQTEQGTWVAEGCQWGYELIRNPNAVNIDGKPKELWNMRVWRLLADNPRRESRIIGGYGSLDSAKWWAEHLEARPDATFKTQWFRMVFGGDKDDDE